MAITLDGTNGIITPGVTDSGALSVSGTTTLSTGILNIGSGQIYKDASGNLGIGTTSPSFSGGSRIALTVNAPTGQFPILELGVNNSLQGYVYANASQLTINKQGANPITFETNGSERARIDSSGNLLVGTTSVNGVGITLNSGNYAYIATTSAQSLYLDRRTTTGILAEFRYGGSKVGDISTNGSGTTYNSGSDKRLKENIVDAPSALSSINAIKVRSFDWKADGSHVDYGYIAQELIEVASEAVSVPADPDEMMGVDFGKLTPRIIKAIQELTARLEALENK